MRERMRRSVLRGGALLIGLVGYGTSMAMMVRAGLGLDPWDVFHQGLALRTPMTIGIATAVVGVVVLLAWIPLRNRPGIGTIGRHDGRAARADLIAGAHHDDVLRGGAQRDQHGPLHRRRYGRRPA